MLKVAQIDYIRYEVNQKGETYANVARRMEIDPRTVTKYANQEEFNVKEPQKRISRVMDPVKPILDKWIKEDLKKKKKNHRTAKKMYEQLVKFHSFKGSARSVRAYVSHRKKEIKEYIEGAALPLEAIPGTAQVDFGEAPFKYLGEVIDLPYLVMSFQNSNTFYFQVFPSENTECLLEGLQRMFRHMGGVPNTIRFDNLSPAVKKIKGKGERSLTDTFERFVLHYGFQYEFCNPGKGNEKGHVEAMVKYVRNNFLLPECTITNLDEFNSTLWKVAEDDRERPHYLKHVLQSELYKEDQEAWLILPEKSFDCTRYEQVKADKYGIVSIDNKEYSTSPRFARQKVRVCITYNSITVLNEDHEIVVTHHRLYGVRRRSMIWQPYLDLLSRRPKAIKYTSLYDQFPYEWSKYLRECTEEEQKAALRLLGSLLKNNDFTLLNEALRIASAHGHPNTDQIKHCFYSLLNQSNSHAAITPRFRVPTMPDASRGLTHYDAFFQEGGVAR
ncbi:MULTISPECIES: IS21 family transposase [Bacillaceae]|uniref:IS21 family transposase n=1 Tax=Evansella alkalicola TaxID=745819 RepID=A0ABS6JYG6_9BACI|nr:MULTISPECIES: IS21 family transposase [Bacillaceae]MBU9720983.1 IS21 family transposase [Bacillus alkalicola]MBU9720993.1 IS21 family transposase [Bacillus alkalicola]MBU9720997.1 IS21 family transposase [Bacillus alkalicola]MBU9721211.1 IS21 family transposase [Bacillus alkalicola]MBU9722080.1 IS21 family transposase [Bacillus alkalicola]